MGAAARTPNDVDPEAIADELDENDPEAPLYSSVELEDEDGDEHVIEQQNVGRDAIEGGREWPDPDTRPRAPAPGS
jgi:hypothetical protein